MAAPAVAQITATGAAYAAGLATGFWSGLDELRANYTITSALAARDGTGQACPGSRGMASGG